MGDDTKVVAAQSAPAPSGGAAKAPDPADILKMLQEIQANQKKLEAKVNPVDKPRAEPEEVKIDWTKVGEREVADLAFPIPVYEHEIPEYMTVHLKDNNYISKWGHTSRRRLGMLLAEGYEYVKSSDWDENYPHILGFDSEDKLVYDDVVALKIHKSRYFGKVRREQQKSMQLKNVAGYNKVAGKMSNIIASDARMEAAMGRGAMSFYDANVESNVEQITI